MSRHRYLKIIYWNFELDPDFPWKTCIDRLPCQFSQKSWSLKRAQNRGATLKNNLSNQYFAHNSTPRGAHLCEIKTTPPESIIFYLLISSNGYFDGFRWSNRAELLPTYTCRFCGRKNFRIFLNFWVPPASPRSPGRSRTKKTGKISKI